MIELYIAVIITLIQLTSCYLRYLPFSTEITIHERNLLIKSFLTWSVVDSLINLYFFSDDINYRIFKITLYAGCAPYFLISLAIIREKIPQHVFVLGMQCLWCFMLHSLSGMVITILYGGMSEEFIPLQLSFYLVIFVLLLKLEQKFFIKLLPTPKMFENEQLKWAISLLPIAIFIGMTISIVDSTFLPTWKGKLSRISIPLFFFTYISLIEFNNTSNN